MIEASAALYVVYRTPSLQLDWLPRTADVVLVLNDDSLDVEALDHPRVRVLSMPENVGFGRAVNRGLHELRGKRVVICNPDTRLAPSHWEALTNAAVDEVVSVPLDDGCGTPTSVVGAYPTATSLLLTAYRVGRVLRRDSDVRARLLRALGSWGAVHQESLMAPKGTWPLDERWLSAAVLSVDAERALAIGGFDPRYFLYFEDVDFCRRLAAHFPGMRARIADVEPAVHKVGGSAATAEARRMVDRHHLQSALRFAGDQAGWKWRLARLLMLPRWLWLRRGAPLSRGR